MESRFDNMHFAYREIRTAYPGEVAVFCCDLGDAWLFKFIPVTEVGNTHFMSGKFGIAVSKTNGMAYQYDMLKNMKLLTSKENFAQKLHD